MKFPYATEEEMQLMEHTLQNALNDIQSNVNLKVGRPSARNFKTC